MQGNTPVHAESMVVLLHVPIHIGIYQAENNRLVAHQSLIMTLGIADGLLIGTAIGRLPPDSGRMPILILLLLDNLYPVIGNIHRHSVIKTVATVLRLNRQTRHTAYLFGNRNSMFVHLMYKLVRQRQVSNGILVLPLVEIIPVTAKRLTQPVTVIKHGSNPVETEAVELILLQPELAIGQQKMKHLILAVIKHQRIPCRMLPPAARMKVLRVRAVETSQPLPLVLHRMAVHNIHDNGNPHPVRLVNQLLQLFRRTEA
ncbi:hypothetical protein Barb4_02032 [Bacteroidales bacterium Barb4]|nr:hypothetical protein Barb4_02032 [Bacteroidales bacterium Barb4]